MLADSSSKRQSEAIINHLKDEKIWLVRDTPKKIILTRKIAKRAVSVVLDRNEKGNYDINPLNYTYHSCNSHFDYVDEESRFTRNKTAIISAIKFLKNSQIWKYIDNKNDFVQVNTFNIKSKKTELGKKLSQILE